MSSELRNHKSVLTPSELAALLGPCTAPVIESATVVAETSTSRWTLFADEFARQLTGRLRPIIRAAVRVTFNGSRTLIAETVTTSQEGREVVSLWQSERSIEPLAVLLSVPLVATFVDRLLGGRSAPNCDETDHHRPLTEVDYRLTSRLNEAVARSVSASTELSSPMELIESPGHGNSVVDAWMPDSSLLRLSFELRFVQGSGSLELLVPIELAEEFADGRKVVDSSQTPLNQMSAECQDLPPSQRPVVVAQLCQTSLSQCDLQSLAVGDVLLMPAELDQTVRVLVDGCPVFEGIAGAIGGHKAIRLTNPRLARAS